MARCPGTRHTVTAVIVRSSLAPTTEEVVEDAPAVGSDPPWITIVWNDPVNLQGYVVYVFQSYFGYAREKATELMLAVHEQGRAVVSHGTRERMEVDTEALQGYGLWATFQKDV